MDKNKEFYSKGLKCRIHPLTKDEAKLFPCKKFGHLCIKRGNELKSYVGECSYQGKCAELESERWDHAYIWDPIYQRRCGSPDSTIFGFVSLPRSLYSNILHKIDYVTLL